jgi:nucleotide-binding universal stress UspA family protein
MKVVVGVDGSKYGKWAVEWIGRLPLAARPSVTAVHVVNVAALRAPLLPQPVVYGNEAFLRQEEKRLERQAQHAADQTRALMRARHLKGTVAVERGSIAATLLRHCGGRETLAVLGSRGLDALDRFMLGSVSTRVLLHTSAPVLIVKQAPRPIERVVLATDGSRSSRRALEFLRSRFGPRAARAKIEVTVATVVPSPKASQALELGRALAAYEADELAQAGYRVQAVTRTGHPADQLVTLSERTGADLLVLGARGLGAVARFFVGSVSLNVVHHSRCSTLVVR